MVSSSDPAIARSLELQRRGYRVVVQQDRGDVTVCVGRRDTPISEDVKATAATFALALSKVALNASARWTAGGEID